uniref:WW domain-containing oxidoreductase n=1 Tax=Ascaris lumbricoides TaxID=6252 RepID=A0A0M3IK67_ASCLU
MKENFVIVHGRSAEKCESTVEYILRENKLPDRSNIDYVVADFSDLKEVALMAAEVQSRFPNLNVLLCNAGVLLPKRTESRNGLEMTFQVNHLAHYLLINRLLETLKINEPSRIIIVSSALHSWHKIDWDDIMAEQEYDKYLQYSRTKLMNHLTAFALHRLLVRQGCHFRVTSNVVELGNSEQQRQKRARQVYSLINVNSPIVLVLIEAPWSYFLFI